ncbi:major facilitator superfamily transporter [Colletotrichum orchidophilum]|uniref:Major facilitator superfamily transporter n=1 Tax=Colletotrichum orchidophilum TaxID=1209926 RepID=A0A1G4AQ78_9PEZI|nr:major facilitator superfamily transporter [Colletotrichum orchidophilum]OHE91327.1 major facilitator superfamily transporter [Colletotrichum orchidophilum]
MTQRDTEREAGSGSGGQATEFDVEFLGRQRPAVFNSQWAELGFCFSLLGSMLMAEYFVSGFHIILPPLAGELDIPAASQTWPSSVFSLVTGAFLLPLGRLGDMYGGYLTFNAGLAWFFIWCLVAGFSNNYMMLIVCRALQGLGSAAYLPAGIMLLGKIYRPGPRKNLVFALYGAFAPIGFFFGILIGGVSGQFLSWRWYFWLGSIVLGIIAAVSFVTIPRDYHDKRQEIRMDWWGAATIVPGLLLVVYAITDSSHAPQGWASPQILVTLILGVALLVAAWYVESRVSANPLLPGDLFAPKSMKTLVAALFFAYGTFGLFLFYSSFYIETVLHMSPLLTAVWYVPLIVGGIMIGTVGGFTLHLLPGRVLLAISGTGNLLSVLLFAIMPDNPNYWAYVFPAMICGTIGIDITYTVSNVFITTNLPSHRQGLAGALINSLLFLGISFFLGIGDVVVGETTDLGLKKSYQAAFWLATGVAAVALVLYALVRIGSAKSDLTMEEREQLAAAEEARLRSLETTTHDDANDQDTSVTATDTDAERCKSPAPEEQVVPGR